MGHKLSREDANYILEHYNRIKNLSERDSKEELAAGRLEFQRDYGRVLYSTSFRRLQGKMQYLGIAQDQFFRNRLTHSLEVEQIAEGLVWILDSKLKEAMDIEDSEKHLIYNNGDIYVLRTAALSHDLGNPPFGHAGEDVLNELSKEYGGFEGNAQTMRIFRFLEKKSPDFKGLNLTMRTLLSVIKYNVRLSGNRRSKFLYEEDYQYINNFLKEKGLEKDVRTLDAQIMDLADEIAYCAHDLEDCLSLKVFDIDELVHEFFLWDEGGETYEKFKAMVDNAKIQAFRSDTLEYKDILKRSMTSQIVNTLINDVGIREVTEKDRDRFGICSTKELRFIKYEKLAEGLKELSFRFVRNRNESKNYKAIGDIVLKKLYEFYEKNPAMMSPEYFKMYESTLGKRAIIDYLAGMMDAYAIKKYEEYYGEIKIGK